MNTDLIASYVRTILKITGTAMLAHGLTVAGKDINAISGMNDVIGAVAVLIGLVWSHFTHASPSTPKDGGSAGGTASLLVVTLAASLLFTGCTTTAQKSAYDAAGISNITVDTALAAYDQFAAAGKTSMAQNLAVENAFLKYQRAMLVVTDAGAVYSAAASSTNAPAASAAFEQAIANGNQSITDFVTLIQSFGVVIKQ